MVKGSPFVVSKLRRYANGIMGFANAFRSGAPGVRNVISKSSPAKNAGSTKTSIMSSPSGLFRKPKPVDRE